jgi:predicted DNA repair protein MutK
MIGGAFLCFEGFEKVAHKLLHSPEEKEARHRDELQALADPEVDMVAFEKEKIRGAIRTDVILSAEIIVITLGTVAAEPFGKQVAVLSAIAALMTVGVYGFVAGIVKLDDAGVALSRRESSGARALGRGILRAAPWLMKTLSIAGTAAMFLVGGGILTHGIPPIHHFAESLTARGGVLGAIGPTLVDALTGIVAGGLAVAVVSGVQRLRKKPAA